MILNDKQEPDKQRPGIEYLGPFGQCVTKALRQELAWALDIFKVPKQSSEAALIRHLGGGNEVRPDHRDPVGASKGVWILF